MNPGETHAGGVRGEIGCSATALGQEGQSAPIVPAIGERTSNSGEGIRRIGQHHSNRSVLFIAPMPSLLSQLTKGERARLLEELNYLNLSEIRGFCSARGIPYRILAEHPSGKVMITKDTDRKPLVLARIRDYLATGKVGPPTCIPAKIVRDDPPPARPGPRDRLYYRWYAKEHIGVVRSLRELTAGQFRDGAVARVLVMEFWTHGEAPTLADFARAWTDANANRDRLLTAEYAYLTDLQHKQAGNDWKSRRMAKAKSALQTLARIA